MKVLLFCHSLLSDWNHGNAHFLRGLAAELGRRGHAVDAYEAEDAWSVQNLMAEVGELPTSELRRFYPTLNVIRYRASELDLEAVTAQADLVIVHEWSDPGLVRSLGRLRIRAAASFKLLFHDTHHRSVTDSESLANLELAGYDGVLAFGAAVRERYLRAGWGRNVWVFHEAADTRVFRPLQEIPREADLVFVGNWGDEERTRELREFMLQPASDLKLRGSVHGVRYPEAARRAVQAAGLVYRGWLPNYRVPEAFARHRVSVHVPRRPYVHALPGIPTIRVFEALACGIPLLSAPWQDVEGLFRTGDLLFAHNAHQARSALRLLLDEPSAAAEIAARGRQSVLAAHTCAHRADLLVEIAHQLGVRACNPESSSSEIGSEEVYT